MDGEKGAAADGGVIASSAGARLSEAEIREIGHEAELYPDRRAVGLEALKIVQRHRGWVSDESLLAVARHLDLPAAELEGVATFFNLIYRRPVGRHVILFCNSVSCWIMGCDRNREHLAQAHGLGFGETSACGAFTLLPAACLGDCDRAPVMMVGRDHHRELTPEAIDRVLDGYRGGTEGEGT